MNKIPWHMLRQKKRYAFLLGCLIGSLVFVWIYGVGVLDVTNTAWLLDSSKKEGLWDLTQHYLGWIFYRQSPWRFPLCLTDGLYSEPISVVYTDSIPLFAIFFKILSPLLPSSFQYFGLFGLLCYQLMGGFGALVTKRVTDHWLINGASAFLFVLAPCLTKRMFYHTALSAHFLILAAFCLWLYRDTFRRRWTYPILWTVLVSLSALINAYFTPMVLGTMLCALLQELLAACRKREVAGKICLTIGVTVVVLGLTCYGAGYFYGDVTASTTGLRQLSFNLLQFCNPANALCEVENQQYLFTTQNYSSILPELPTVSGWQEEGFSYLGCGMLLLLGVVGICGLVHGIRGKKHCRKDIVHDKRKRNSFIISIAVGAVCFLFLALSPRITAGSSILCEISYPGIIERALGVFRSTGRLIWPVYYGCMTAALLGAIRFLQKRKTLMILLLVGVCAIQLYDLSPALSYKHVVYAKAADAREVPYEEALAAVYQSYLPSEVWKYLGEQADEIVFYPPTEYGVECDPKTSCIFEEYALDYNLNLNVTYMSRDMSKQADQRTYEHFAERKAGQRYANIIYIFFESSQIPAEADSGLHYYLVDGYIVGTEQDLGTWDGIKMLSY